MSVLKSKKILIGICGGIAAYKIILLIRLLKKAGAEVKVILTDSAADFVGKVTLATVSENPVYDHMTESETGLWTNHVELGLWAEVFLIAPLTANTLAKMATGQANNLLLTTYLSARCPVFVAPAMDLDMWAHPTTKENIEALSWHGVSIIEPTNGLLASGLSGKGRMEEPEELFKTLNAFFSKNQDLLGKKALITLGPTVESIDPVRFISNRSTGKMGIEIANSLKARGADVWLVAGPVQIDLTEFEEKTTKVRSASDMYEAVNSKFEEMDIVVFAAAVADYTPTIVAKQKIKKAGDKITIELTKTRDIAASLGLKKKPNQFLIGFALETENELEHARQKLVKKNLDVVVLNSLNDPDSGFEVNTNKITILNTKGETFEYETKSKKDVANDIVNYVVENLPKI